MRLDTWLFLSVQGGEGGGALVGEYGKESGYEAVGSKDWLVLRVTWLHIASPARSVQVNFKFV